MIGTVKNLGAMPSCIVQVQWERVMRRLIIMEGDVEEGSTPLKDLFDQVSQGQTKVNFAQVKVLLPCPAVFVSYLLVLSELSRKRVCTVSCCT